jgi:hypothetical protein
MRQGNGDAGHPMHAGDTVAATKAGQPVPVEFITEQENPISIG